MGSVFRMWYGHVCQIRSFVTASTPVLALTATATEKTRCVLLQHLKMTTPHIIAVSPNRANIRFAVVKASRDCESAFQWLIVDLCEMRKNTLRVVVFCRSITMCTRLYKYFLKGTEL